MTGARQAAKGQAVFEYAVLISLVVAALMAMQLYAKRGLQAAVKTAADRMSPFASDPDGVQAQVAGVRYESGDRRNRAIAAGTVLENRSKTTTVATKTVQDKETLGGGRERVVQDDQTTTSGALGGGVSSYSQVVVDAK